MSKKLFTEPRWKKHLQKRQMKELEKHHRHRSRPAHAPVVRVRRRFLKINAPPVFSLRKNPEEVIRFLNILEQLGRHNHIQLEFEEVREITPEAIAALIATMGKQVLAKTVIRGNLPKCEPCQQILVESGFFDHVRHSRQLPPVRGRIKRRKSKKVEPTLAKELIDEGVAQTGKKHSEASYRILIESMGNTWDHASPPAALSRVQNLKRKRQPGTDNETWWAMAYADITRKRVCFVFLDTGVGIFKSVKIKTLRKIVKALRNESDSALLEEILLGKLGSRSELPYRGKGLPAIRELSDRGEISELTLITNSVFADVSAGAYSSLEAAFHGTLLYWEI